MMSVLAVVVGLVVLVWSADRFVEGAAVIARHFGMSTLLIGMVILGFGTSAPEMVVSALAASQGNPGIALGNAYGSNIANIGLILGLTALLSPIAFARSVWRRELPILAGVTVLAAWQVWSGSIDRLDAWLLLLVFGGLMGWTVWQGLNNKTEVVDLGDLDLDAMSPGRAGMWLVVGLVLLVASSRLLVWGAVDIAQMLGVSDLIIGLTIVAVGTSLPELAASLAALRKQEHDMVLGNVLGSNLFNTLAVVGIAGAISPMVVPPEVLYRDIGVMSVLTLSLFLFGGLKRIGRLAGGALLVMYVGYSVYLVMTVINA